MRFSANTRTSKRCSISVFVCLTFSRSGRGRTTSASAASSATSAAFLWDLVCLPFLVVSFQLESAKFFKSSTIRLPTIYYYIYY